MRSLVAQFARFGVVGAIGFVIDTTIFAILISTVLDDDVVHEGPLLAKVVSTTVAILFNWMGNRHWTFRAHRGRQLMREGIEFGIVSLGGMAIGLACLWVSHYALGFTSQLADIISSNVIGLGLGTLFRFTLYRAWVFAPHRGEPEPALFPEVGMGGADEPESALGETLALREPTAPHPS
ncbi:MAG: GtrA family protein [Pseudolysinimonas sp.]